MFSDKMIYNLHLRASIFPSTVRSYTDLTARLEILPNQARRNGTQHGIYTLPPHPALNGNLCCTKGQMSRADISNKLHTYTPILSDIFISTYIQQYHDKMLMFVKIYYVQMYHQKNKTSISTSCNCRGHTEYKQVQTDYTIT